MMNNLAQTQKEIRRKERAHRKKIEAQQRQIAEKRREYDRKQEQYRVEHQQRQQQEDARIAREEERRQQEKEERQLVEQKRMQREEKARARREKEERIVQEKAQKVEAKKRADREFLAEAKRSIRLGAKTCFGETHIGGYVPRSISIQHKCKDVYFTASCPGEMGHSSMLEAFTGMGGVGCFGDTKRIPNGSCKAEEMRVVVDRVEFCQ